MLKRGNGNSRQKAKEILKEYESNSDGWLAQAGEALSKDSGGLIGAIIAIVGFVIWQSIKHFS